MPLRKVTRSISRPVSNLEAQCTHLTMTRVYGTTHTCNVCQQPGAFGWVYQCTQDMEAIIDDAIAHGDLSYCDQVGLGMVNHLNAQRSTRPIHHDKFSFLDELSLEQMTNYRPDQIATLLRQKEKASPLSILSLATLSNTSAIQVQAIVQQDRMSQNGASLAAHDGLFNLSEPLPSPVCTACRPTCMDRSYMSLNAIAKGHVPPTAVTGFGFQAIAGRPVTDARILRTIGLRQLPPRVCPVEPWPSPADATKTTKDGVARSTPDNAPRLSWIDSSLCLMELLERQIACGSDLLAAIDDDDNGNDDAIADEKPCSVIQQAPCTGTLTRSPPCSNLDNIALLLPPEQRPSTCAADVASEAALQCESSPLFDVPQRPALGLHVRSDTETSYGNLRLGGAATGFERGISDMITAV